MRALRRSRWARAARKNVRPCGALKHFQGQDLDVHGKSPYLGEKTFAGIRAEIHETKFNYTLIRRLRSY